MADYQLASDGYDGQARSGVIKSDGAWCACEADNELWEAYQEWLKVEGNKPDPYKSPADGGLTIKLAEGQEVVGAMADSMPPPEPAPAPTPPPPEPPAAPEPRVGGSRRDYPKS